MLNSSVESSPRLYARAGGALYLANILLGLFGQFSQGKVIVPGDAAATATRLAAAEPLWRWGVTAEYIGLVCAVALAMVYYVLLRPVRRELNLLATFLRLVSFSVEAVAAMGLAAALFPLGQGRSLAAFSAEQRQALTNLALRWHDYGFGVALFILGFAFLAHGYLIYKSRFLPGFLGILIELAGLAYLTNSFALFLAPAAADRIFPAILLPAFVGEVSLCLWLFIKGVDERVWREVNAEFLRRVQAGV